MKDNQSRRDFIKRLAALVAAGVVSPSLFFGAKEGFDSKAFYILFAFNDTCVRIVKIPRQSLYLIALIIRK